MTWELPCFWENGRFSDNIWAWEHCVFKKIDVFLTKYGRESSDFFLKNRKKMASYQLFWPIIQCRFDTIDVFFDQTWALQEGVFHDFVFKWQENTVILKEYSIVLTELTFFLPNMGMTEGGFSWKIWKKLHESIVFLREWRFFWQNLAMKAVVFLEIDVFLTKYGYKTTSL